MYIYISVAILAQVARFLKSSRQAIRSETAVDALPPLAVLIRVSYVLCVGVLR